MCDCVCVFKTETDNSAIVFWEIHHLVIVRFTVQKREDNKERENKWSAKGRKEKKKGGRKEKKKGRREKEEGRKEGRIL